MHLVLFQPDIPQNTGAMLRLSACFGLTLHIIEPCGFVFDDRKLKRSGMDYIDQVDIRRHASWKDFINSKEKAGRLVLLTTKATDIYYDHTFQKDDYLIVGQESVGAPDYVHESVDARVKIPLTKNARSFNVAMSAAIVVSEAVRQINKS